MNFADVLTGDIAWAKLDESTLIDDYAHYKDDLTHEIASAWQGNVLSRVDVLLAKIYAGFLFAQHLNLVLGYYKLFTLVYSQSELLKSQLADHFADFIHNLHGDLQPRDARFQKYLSRILRVPLPSTQADLADAKNQFAYNMVRDIDERKLELDASYFVLIGISDALYKELLCNGRLVLSAAQHVNLYLMSFCEDQRLRQAYWHFTQGRCEANGAILAKQIYIKRQAASEMGYGSVMDWKLDGRMVSGRKYLDDFYSQVYSACKGYFSKDIRVLSYKPLDPWDVAYLHEKRKACVAIDIRQLDKYFPSDLVVGRFLAFFEARLDIRFIKIYTNAWNATMQSFDVVRDKTKIARLHFDLLQREKKAAGGWFQVIAPGVYSVQANFSPETKNFTYQQAVTIIHEMGHALHCIYAQDWYQSRGSLDVPWDFVEVPSQFCECFLENWPFISELAVTREGTPITYDEFSRLYAYNRDGSSLFIMRQLSLGYIDLLLHNDYNGEDLDEYIWSHIAKYSASKTPQRSIVRHFSHLFGNSHDYTCGYYSYMWSDCLRISMFERFLHDTSLYCFADAVLRPGATVDPWRLLEVYGAKMSLEAYLSYYGVSYRDIENEE